MSDYDVHLDFNAKVNYQIEAENKREAILKAIEKLERDGLNPAVQISYGRIEDEWGNTVFEHYFTPYYSSECVKTPDNRLLPINQPDMRYDNKE